MFVCNLFLIPSIRDEGLSWKIFGPCDQLDIVSSNSQPSTKRARRIASDPKGQQDTNEELSQVANLVEKRRLQNRISQRNYREQGCSKFKHVFRDNV